MAALKIDPQKLRYRALIGTGGIGSGLFFALSGNHTLGREESRAGRFLDRRDYCKLHIIAHYVQVLLGPDFRAILLGKVGEDATGQRLMEEMRQAGLDTRYVQVAAGQPTMLSVVFTYPDGSGGNLTPENSACDSVDPAYIQTAQRGICSLCRAGGGPGGSGSVPGGAPGAPGAGNGKPILARWLVCLR